MPYAGDAPAEKRQRVCGRGSITEGRRPIASATNAAPTPANGASGAVNTAALRRSPKLTRFCSVKVIQAENAMGKGMQESSMEGITASKQE